MKAKSFRLIRGKKGRGRELKFNILNIPRIFMRIQKWKFAGHNFYYCYRHFIFFFNFWNIGQLILNKNEGIIRKLDMKNDENYRSDFFGPFFAIFLLIHWFRKENSDFFSAKNKKKLSSEIYFNKRIQNLSNYPLEINQSSFWIIFVNPIRILDILK